MNNQIYVLLQSQVILRMKEIRISNRPLVTETCDLNKSPARHHLSLKLGLKLKYLYISQHKSTTLVESW